MFFILCSYNATVCAGSSIPILPHGAGSGVELYRAA